MCISNQYGYIKSNGKGGPVFWGSNTFLKTDHPTGYSDNIGADVLANFFAFKVPTVRSNGTKILLGVAKV